MHEQQKIMCTCLHALPLVLHQLVNREAVHAAKDPCQPLCPRPNQRPHRLPVVQVQGGIAVIHNLSAFFCQCFSVTPPYNVEKWASVTLSTGVAHKDRDVLGPGQKEVPCKFVFKGTIYTRGSHEKVRSSETL